MAHRGFLIPASTPMAERIQYYTVVDVETRCWTWLGNTDGNGYGRITLAGKCLYAHRESYTTFVGPIPAGLQIDHLCRNRSCVNPEHLEPVTPQTNVMRGTSPGALARQRTHCAAGHDFATHGVVWCGRRVCRTCRVAYSREYREKYVKKSETAA